MLEHLKKHRELFKGFIMMTHVIEMPDAGNNTMAYSDFRKQMNAPVVIYVQFESLVKKVQTCERGQGDSGWTENTSIQEPCGYGFVVVWSEGEVDEPRVYRRENAVKQFLKSVLEEERRLRELLKNTASLTMLNKDWQSFGKATYEPLGRDYKDGFKFHCPTTRACVGLAHKRTK